MIKILIVEDDIDLLEMFFLTLTNENYQVLTAKDGEKALDVFFNEKVDLIILDIMMPKINGFELTEEIRKVNKEIPILMVTALNDYSSLQKGFSYGVDDYMIKPVNINEMLLRIKALLRRAKINSDKKIYIGQTYIDQEQLMICYKDKEIVLPLKEFYLLFKLISSLGKIFTRQQLMNDIWGWDSDSDDRTINTHINRLRDKLIDNDDFAIITIRGLGYKAVKK